MATAIGGMAFIKVDGDQFSSDGAFTVNILNTQRTAVVGTNGEVHYTEEPVASTVSGTLFTTADLDVKALVEASDVTVTIELNSGRVAVLSEAVFTGDASLDAQAGTLEVEFAGRGRWA